MGVAHGDLIDGWKDTPHRECLFYKPEHTGTRTDLALKRMMRLLRRKAIICVISDFLDLWENQLKGPEAKDDRALNQIALCNQRHDLICLQITDPRELIMPNVGWIRLEDGETGEIIEVDTGDAAVREAFRKNNEDRLELIEKAFRRAGVDAEWYEACLKPHEQYHPDLIR